MSDWSTDPRLSRLHRPAETPPPRLTAALDAIEALCAAPASGDDLRRHTARHMLRAAAMYAAGVSAHAEMRAVLSAWAQSPDGFPALGLSPEDVAALIGACEAPRAN